MKKVLVVFAFILICTQNYLLAKEVDYTAAKQVAENFFNGSLVELVYSPIGSSGKTLYYVFNLKNDVGFVFVSGDDSQKPILAYSKSEKFKVPETRESSHIRFTFDNLTKSLDSVLSQKTVLKSQTELWQSHLSQKNITGTKSSALIGPLLTTKWGQDLGSYASQVGGCPAGCVATAIGQIMYYYKFPEKGNRSKTIEDQYGVHNVNFGETYYKWDNMDSESINNENVSELLYHISIAINSEYNNSGTGATPDFIINSIPKYFSYKTEMSYNGRIGIEHPQSISIDSVKSIIKNQLKQGKPVILSARNPQFSAGHAFICDGYDEQYDFFHINWGWNGSNNGYYGFSDMNAWAVNDIAYNIEPNMNPGNTGTSLYTPLKSINPTNLFPCGAGTHLPLQLNDFDKNGFLDLFSKDKIIFNNDGDFSNNNTKGYVGDPFYWNDYMDAADVNNDQKTDYLLTGLTGTYGSFRQSVFLCTGGDNYTLDTLQVESYGEEEVAYVMANFINLVGDEKQDIFFMYGEISSVPWWGGISDTVTVKGFIYENTNGKFVKKSLNNYPYLQLYNSEWDIDEDGKDELFGVDYKDWVYFRDPCINFYKISANGFELVTSVPVECDNMTAINTGPSNFFTDIDNDGIPELVGMFTEVRIIDNLAWGFNSIRVFKLTNGVYKEIYKIDAPEEINVNITYYTWHPNMNIVDFNADGYMDIVVAWSYMYNTYCIEYLTNDKGTGFISNKEYPDQVNAGNTAWGDFDNNGYMDFVLPNTFYKNSLNPASPKQNTLPDPPTSVEAVQVGRELLINWSLATDDMTQQAGLTYNLRVGTRKNSGDIISPNKSPGTGNMLFKTSKTIKNISDGKYYVQVQAFDHSMQPGEWSDVSSDVVTTSEGLTFEIKDIILSVNETSQLVVSGTGKSKQAEGYIWTSSNPDAIQVSQAGVVTASKLGFAVITVQNPDDLSQKATCIVTVDNNFTSTNPNVFTKNENPVFRVSPNPITGQFNLRIDSEAIRDFNLILVNSVGQVVEKRSVKHGGKGHVEQFDISKQSKGIYYLLFSSDKYQFSEKIVLQ